MNFAWARAARRGALVVKPHGAFLSGETAAALENLCEQLPNALELCVLIEEKLRLERELSERERLALVGQMAASISHNLKNPLGSIKTILQVQLENPELPESLRGETKIVLSEVGRLSAKLNQLLQFSRPTVLGSQNGATCDARAVLQQVAEVLQHEADRRGCDLMWTRERRRSKWRWAWRRARRVVEFDFECTGSKSARRQRAVHMNA